MVKVKICGITNIEDALTSTEAGCDALGFIFYKKSPRYISPQEAKAVIRALPKNVIKIGVFVNAREDYIRRIAKYCGLNMLQFHGDESSEFCAKFKGYKIIKAFRIKSKEDTKDIFRYRVFAYLFDTKLRSKFGGTGLRFNWSLVRHIDGLRRPVFLSGGLSAQNVLKAIETLHPDWVDVSSSVELKPGKKDRKKVNRFIQTVKGKEVKNVTG